MKWDTPNQKDGDKRERRGFLFLPRTINEKTRWLEWAVWEERLIVSWGDWWWTDVQWKDLDE